MIYGLTVNELVRLVVSGVAVLIVLACGGGIGWCVYRHVETGRNYDEVCVGLGMIMFLVLVGLVVSLVPNPTYMQMPK